MQTFLPLKAYCFLCLVFIHTLSAVAQRPPTGGPNPPTGPTDPPCKGCPVIFTAVGVAVAGAAYYVIHRHFRTVPTGEQLSTQLFRRGILPTADALNLVYTLNPHLKNQARMRRSRKLVWPELPPLSPHQPAAPDAQTSRALLENINAQLGLLESNLNKFRGAGIAAENGNVNLASVDAALSDIEKNVAAFKATKEAGNVEQGQLLTDLLHALNGTLQQNINTKRISSKEAAFIGAISENVTELLLPVAADKPRADNRSGLYYKTTPGTEQKLYASLAAPAIFPDHHFPDRPLRFPGNRRSERTGGNPAYVPPEKTARRFAFAINKVDSKGNFVTTGPEVMGKYTISYAVPALAHDPSYFHQMDSAATYAHASLYPAKYAFKVTGPDGKQASLPNPLIDIRGEFRNRRSATNQEITIILRVNHD